MNRWYLAALGTLILGGVVAFFIVPFDDGSCPTGLSGEGCVAWGATPRIATVIVTLLVALSLATAGSVGQPKR
jgi:hypothetical protein